MRTRRRLGQPVSYFRVCWDSGQGGLQMAFFCASGAHVLKYTPLRFSKTTIFPSP
jgi:hypothetical protein